MLNCSKSLTSDPLSSTNADLQGHIVSRGGEAVKHAWNSDWIWMFVVLFLMTWGGVAHASEYAESMCEENADDLKRLAYWLIVGGVLTTPIGIGALILPIGGFLWLVAELWWGIC